MIHIYYGDGKGKTTASLGLALRFIGSGGRVAVFQFLKSPGSSECFAFENSEKISFFTLSKKFGFYDFAEAKEKAFIADEIREMFNKFIEVLHSKKYGLIILDEILDTINLGLIDENYIYDVLNSDCEFILTGRNPSQKLLDLSDYASQILKKKHPYDKGAKARKGIEY